MRRGITPVVAIALLLGMTVAASGGAYTFISQAQQQAQEDASASLATEVRVRSIRCEDTSAVVGLSNTGDRELQADSASAFLHTDGELVDAMDKDVSGAAVLQPGGFSELEFPFTTYLSPGTRYTVEVRFDGADVAVEQRCQARTGSLVGYWNFDEKIPGNVTDMTGNGNEGTLFNREMNGTLTNFDFDADSGWVDGRIGDHALAFDGTDDQVEVPVEPSFDFGQADPFTVSAWVKRTGNTGGVVTKGHTTEYYGFDLNGGSLRFGVRDGGTSSASVSEPIAAGEWVHAVGTYEPGQDRLTLYVDGQEIGTASTASVGEFDSPNILQIGGDWRLGGGSTYVAETIDEVRIYDRSLSADEVAALHTGTDIRSGLVGEWTFDEGSETVAHDTSKWVDGKDGLALALDSADDFVDLGDRDNMEGLSTFTVAGWMKFAELPGGNSYTNLMTKSSVFYTGAHEDNFYIRAFDEGSGSFLVDGSALQTGTWYHIAMVYDSGTAYGYLNGQQDITTSATSGSLDSSSYNAEIGSETRYDVYGGNSTVDDIRVYGSALTAEQIAALYNATN